MRSGSLPSVSLILQTAGPENLRVPRIRIPVSPALDNDCVLAEKPRALISQRTREALKAAKTKGKRLGNPNMAMVPANSWTMFNLGARQRRKSHDQSPACSCCREQHTPADWMISNVRDVVGASAQQVKETSKTSLDARAVVEIYRDAPSILRDRADSVFHAGMAIIKAEMDANFDQVNQMAETKNLQDVIRLQMTWGANETLAICRALSKANGFDAVGGAKQGCQRLTAPR
jgi:hypothetical protein